MCLKGGGVERRERERERQRERPGLLPGGRPLMYYINRFLTMNQIVLVWYWALFANILFSTFATVIIIDNFLEYFAIFFLFLSGLGIPI